MLGLLRQKTVKEPDLLRGSIGAGCFHVAVDKEIVQAAQDQHRAAQPERDAM